MLNRFNLHPLTGQPLVPLGYRKDGRAIWPILGAAESDENKPDRGKTADDKPSDAKPDDNAKTDDPGAGGKDALKADLARERDKRQAIEKQLAEMRDGFAKALGVKPEETSDTDKLASSIADLQKKFDEADRGRQRLEIANEFGVSKDDLHMLTAMDEDGLRKQAEWIKNKNEQLEKSGDSKNGKNGKPKPDASQGNGRSGDQKGGGSVAQVMADRRAAREAKNNS